MTSYRWPQVLAYRWHRSLLHCPPGEPASAARTVCGVQAQIPAPGELQLWHRVQGLTRDRLTDELWNRRTLVRTWAARATVHVLAVDDYGLYVAAMREQRMAELDRWISEIGLDHETVDEICARIKEALAAGEPLSRRQLIEQLPDTEPLLNQFGGIMRRLAASGEACFGPPQGSESTFVGTREWLGPVTEFDPAAARRELVCRYLHAYGPADERDFAHWSGLRMKYVRAAFADARSQLVPVRVEDRDLWLRARDLPDLDGAGFSGDVVGLLPRFDVYVLAHRDKSAIMTGDQHRRVFTKAAWVAATVVVGGRVAGLWSHKLSGKRIRISVELFGRQSAGVKREIERLGGDLGRFHGVEAAVAYE